MTKLNFQKQHEMELAIFDVVKHADAEPEDVILTMMRSAYIALHSYVKPDEDEHKKEIMHKAWDDFFLILSEETDERTSNQSN